MKNVSLLFLALTLLHCVQNPPPSEKMETVKSGEVGIDYHDSGKGDTILLFLHGSYIDQTYWADQVKYFSPHYRVITMDFPGHGKSGRNRDNWTLGQFARDVEALMDQLDLHKVILIGHSKSGDIALEAAVAQPERVIGLVGIDTFKDAAAVLDSASEQQVAALMQQLRTDYAGTNEAYARKALLQAQTDSTVVKRVANDFRNAYPPIGIPLLNDLFHYGPREQELFRQLKIKLYLLNVDYYPTKEEPLKTYPASGYELVSMHGTSHYLMIENPAEFNRLLEQIIRRIGAS